MKLLQNSHFDFNRTLELLLENSIGAITNMVRYFLKNFVNLNHCKLSLKLGKWWIKYISNEQITENLNSYLNYDSSQ